jgi:hypothetical protein
MISFTRIERRGVFSGMSAFRHRNSNTPTRLRAGSSRNVVAACRFADTHECNSSAGAGSIRPAKYMEKK